jgi:hypothetical protein
MNMDPSHRGGDRLTPHATPAPGSALDDANPAHLAGLGFSAIAALVGLLLALRPAPAKVPEATTAIAAPALAPAAPITSAASAPASASAAARQDTPLPGASSHALSTRFVEELEHGRYVEALAAFEQLAEADPKAARDRALRDRVVDLTMRLSLMNAPEGERLFSLITFRTGTTGPDILYELMTTRGGSKAAVRAEELLRRDEVRLMGTPALRIAYDLRTARCSQKSALFRRAEIEGDRRALGQLELMNQDCDQDEGCCMPGDRALKATIAVMRKRLL